MAPRPMPPRSTTAFGTPCTTRVPRPSPPRLRLTHLQPNRKGDPEQPLSDSDLEGKLLELASPVIGGGQARALLARIWALDTSDTLP